MNVSTHTQASLSSARGDATTDVAEIVQSLGRLRRASQNREYLDIPPELPSRQAIGTMIEAFVAALFPRHFGPPGLDQCDIDSFVTSSLETGLRELRRQVRLELALARHRRHPVKNPVTRTADEIVAQFAAALPGVRAVLESDIQAAYEGDPSAKSVDELVSCFPGIAAIIRHRMAHILYRQGITMIARIIAEFAHSETGIDIQPGATIDEGFFIDHGTGVVIGETAIIGRNVRLYQAVTLGAKRFEVTESGALQKDYPRHPIVEDDVVIYSGATVLGRVTIGRGSSIGGNVWLTHSVPPGTHVTQARLRSDSFDEGAGI